jgi:hypothetical protein
MKALVVYESLWGNTAAIAREVAAGIGPDAEALTTDAATPQKVAEADLIVAGAPVQGFRLADDRIRESIARDEAGSSTPPDLAHPSLRAWLGSLPRREAVVAASRRASGGRRAAPQETSSACSRPPDIGPSRRRRSSW